MRLRAVVELALAVVAAVGCGASWIGARSTVVTPPMADGEPATTSITYSPSWLFVALVLGTLAGVLAVVGCSRVLR